MNTGELTLAQITQQMDETLRELHRLHNTIMGARLFRDACIKEHRAMTNDFYEIFENVIRPLELAFDAASAQHVALYDLSK